MRRLFAVTLVALLALALVPFAKDKHQGPCVLKAHGPRGWIKFSASGPGKVRVAGKGSLTLENVSQQQLKIDGTWGEKRSLPDGVVYTHFEGSVEAVGIGISLEMRGWNLEFESSGKGGKAKFQGEGTAQLDDGPVQAWPAADDTTHGWLKITYGDH